MKRNLARLLRVALTAIIVAMLFLFARTVNWSATWAAIRSASVAILVGAAVVNLASITLKALRWWVFLRAIGASSLWLALRATLAGAGLNNVLVANGGEAARVIFVSRAAHVPSARVLATLALERLFELIGYIVMLVIAMSFLSLPANIARFRPVAWVALVAVAGLVVYLVRHTASVAAEVAQVTPVGWRARLGRYGSRFMQTLSVVSTGPRFAGALALSVGAWGLQVATYLLTAKAAHFELSAVGTIAAIIAVNLGFALRATPGNVGLFQMMYAVTAVAFGMNKDQAIGVAFLIQTQQILPVTALGIALAPEFIFRRRQGRRADDPIDKLPFESRQPLLQEDASSPRE